MDHCVVCLWPFSMYNILTLPLYSIFQLKMISKQVGSTQNLFPLGISRSIVPKDENTPFFWNWNSIMLSKKEKFSHQGMEPERLTLRKIKTLEWFHVSIINAITLCISHRLFTHIQYNYFQWIAHSHFQLTTTEWS